MKIRLLSLALITFLLAACAAPAGQTQEPTNPPTSEPTQQPDEAPTEEPVAAASPTATNAEVPAADQPTPTTESIAAPVCSGELTSANMEGPYYTPDSPQKDSLLEDGMPGTVVLIRGYVLDAACNPIPGAKVDFWQADSEGVYDNAGFRLRGHVLADENGAYSIETIAPGEYPGRPEHIHVKVFAADGRELLTTQLYLPGAAGSADVNASPDLLVTYESEDDQGRQLVTFNFIVNP
jgi:protocatechuate 3,4-dioxygenase beta subunit